MWQYFLRRLLLVIPTFLGITVVVFTITRFVPGGPIEKAMLEAKLAEGGSRGSSGSASLSEDQMNQLKEYYGFDKPVLISYAHWLGKVLRFDLGNSTRYNEPVIDTILERLKVSAFYGICVMLLTYLICVPLGIIKAIFHRSWIDDISSIGIFAGYALPGYIIGIGSIIVLSVQWEIFPIGGFVGNNFSELPFIEKVTDLLWHAALPLSAYVIPSLAIMTMLVKNNLMDHLASEYVRTAMAKGLGFWRAVVGHALQNSLIPLATHFGNNLSVILAGTFLLEKIFNINGFGLLGYEAIVERDYPVVLGILVIASILQLIGNIISDLCVAALDPRVKFH